MFNKIFNFAKKEIWKNEIFINYLVLSMENEKFSKNSILEIRTLLDQKSISSIEELVKFTENPDISLETKKNIERLKLISDYNSTCYIKNSKEKTRTIQWPNNPQTKKHDPNNYFDIYSDYFYKRHTRFITKETAIGSAGSCFALRIAHQLQAWGYNYVIEEDDAPEGLTIQELVNSTYRMAPARFGTLFNLPTIRQVIERGFGEWNAPKIISADDSRIFDPFRRVKAHYYNDETYELDYAKHTQLLNKALLRCDVFIITLGLTEAWYFAHSNDYVCIQPYRIDPILLRRKNLTVEENINELEKIFQVYKKYKPSIKFIISVSPVPLNKTFNENEHVVAATAFSKAKLRVAAQEFVEKHREDAFYFPSFETVMYGCKTPWEEDKRHVSPEAIKRVMELFQKQFLVDQTPLKFYSHVDPGLSVKTTKLKFVFLKIYHQIKKYIKKYVLRFR